MEDSQLVRGIVLDKDISHPGMRKEIADAKICILTCPFEPPKPKTKHNIQIDTVEKYQALYAQEQAYYECLSCEAAFVRYDDDWRPIPRDELPSEWLKQARRQGDDD